MTADQFAIRLTELVGEVEDGAHGEDLIHALENAVIGDPGE